MKFFKRYYLKLLIHIRRTVRAGGWSHRFYILALVPTIVTFCIALIPGLTRFNLVAGLFLVISLMSLLLSFVGVLFEITRRARQFWDRIIGKIVIPPLTLLATALAIMLARMSLSVWMCENGLEEIPLETLPHTLTVLYCILIPPVWLIFAVIAFIIFPYVSIFPLMLFVFWQYFWNFAESLLPRRRKFKEIVLPRAISFSLDLPSRIPLPKLHLTRRFFLFIPRTLGSFACVFICLTILCQFVRLTNWHNFGSKATGWLVVFSDATARTDGSYYIKIEDHRKIKFTHDSLNGPINDSLLARWLDSSWNVRILDKEKSDGANIH